ncbi:MAG: cobalamin-dependent protein [Desulfurivibrio sp.]|nr:cobalamin-dependent protein [Desulfurivibrio sp.]
MSDGTQLTILPRMAGKNEPLARQYLQLLLAGKRVEGTELVLQAAQDGVSLQNIYLEILKPALYEVGELWQRNRLTVAREHLCTAAVQYTMSQLYPRILKGKQRRLPYAFLGCCVGGELHEVGMRMVTDLFEMAGWDTLYMGANAADEVVVDEVARKKIEVVGISITIIAHLHLASRLIMALRSRRETANVLILVGGYSFIGKPELSQTIGADAVAIDPLEAIRTAGKLLEEKRG